MPSIFAILLFFWISSGPRVWAFQVPTLTGPVVDQVGWLSKDEIYFLEQTLREALKRGKIQLQVLIVPSLKGESVEQVALQVVDQWKLGTAKSDNGVLLLIAEEERAIRIEVGQGLEGDIPDIYAKRIIEDTMIPLFREGAQGRKAGVIAGIMGIIRRADPDFPSLDPSRVMPYRARSEQRVSSSFRQYGDLFFILLMLISAIFSKSFRRQLLNGRRGGYGSGNIFGSGGGFSGGGGGWSGGGGGFSGGGASGRW